MITQYFIIRYVHCLHEQTIQMGHKCFFLINDWDITINISIVQIQETIKYNQVSPLDNTYENT